MIRGLSLLLALLLPSLLPADEAAVRVGAEDLKSGRVDGKRVSIAGKVQDCFHDENDPRWIYLVVGDDETVFATLLTPEEKSARTEAFRRLQALVGATIEIVGTYRPSHSIVRKLTTRMIFPIPSLGSIRILKPAPSDPFSVPELGNTSQLSAADIPTLGRRRVAGRVLTTWKGNRFLLRDEDREIHLVSLADSVLPKVGSRVEVAGRTQTDLYNVNLSGAVWRSLPSKEETEEPAEPITTERLLCDERGNPMINAFFHGSRVRVIGTVQEHLKDRAGQRLLLIRDGNFFIQVDVTAADESFDQVETGSRVEVDGICVVETGTWVPNAEFPHATGITIVTNGPEDVRVIRRAPWLTQRRLLGTTAALLVVIVAIFIWNVSLRRLAERRGRALFREQVTRAKSEMHVEERTSLAVELHDSLSQNLTGVSFQVNMAERLVSEKQTDLKRHLSIAMKTLQSCRDELRNCIYDLRNQALDQADMDEAIRITLRPHLGPARLTVRFNVPRARLSENTTHAILKIIRELSSNALRHGKATAISVAGAIEEGRLLVSVRDDGCGFDPETCPDMSSGHFGLQGIRERIRQFDGTLQIESVPGAGTRAVVILKLHTEQSA